MRSPSLSAPPPNPRRIHQIHSRVRLTGAKNERETTSHTLPFACSTSFLKDFSRRRLPAAGLDEGILTMRSGGIRRLYIPGELAFPKGLASAPGRPRISPFSPVVFDVKLIYIPGLE